MKDMRLPRARGAAPTTRQVGIALSGVYGLGESIPVVFDHRTDPESGVIEVSVDFFMSDHSIFGGHAELERHEQDDTRPPHHRP